MAEIDRFWQWWKSAASGLANTLDSGSALSAAQVEEINRRVHAIGDLVWETGPGTSARHHFTLSGQGDAQLRIVTERWLGDGPAASEVWQFYPARQPRRPREQTPIEFGGRQFLLEDFQLRSVRDEDRERLDLSLYHPLFAQLDASARHESALQALGEVLGEDGVARWVGTIDVHRTPFEGLPLSALQNELAALIGDWKGDRTWLVEGKTASGFALVALVNPSLKRLDHLLKDHHYELSLELVDVTASGLPDDEESRDLDAFEDELMTELGAAAVWVGHETYEGKRVIHFHADSTAALQQKIEHFVEADGRWDGELVVEYDPDWQILDKY